MIREDEALLDYFRQKPFCEKCGARSPGRLDPHHVLHRGHSGGTRLDTSLNLVALCRRCHHKYGDDPKWEGYFLGLVAYREGMKDGAAVKDALDRLLRRPRKEINGYHVTDFD